MASPILENLRLQVENTVGVLQSAKVFIDGTATRLQAAVDAALLNGATAAELEPITAEIEALKTNSDAVAAAIASNP